MASKIQINRFETAKGSEVVRSVRNIECDVWQSTVWANYGKDITTFRATHNTEVGARKWAAKQLAR